jgi:NTE family protein
MSVVGKTRGKTVALALGGGGARGLSHIAVFEALDDMGIKPVAIAGTSIGALLGAAYAAGMSGREIRRYVIKIAHDRAGAMRRLMRCRAGGLRDLFGAGFGDATRLDPEKICTQFLPEDFPNTFAELQTPLTVVASDLYLRKEVAFSDGPLLPALAASIALPSLMRPVVRDGRILVDGGATNPLPFDLLRGRADIIVAVEVSGTPTGERRAVPSAWECLFATVLVMANAIVSEKLKHSAPDLLLLPNVGTFRTLDFFHASAILRVAEPLKAELKGRLSALLQAQPRGVLTG